MLAQNFMTPAALGISDTQFEALVKVLGMLERDEIPYAPYGNFIDLEDPDKAKNPVAFNMYHFASEAECGTACCLCGWATLIGRLPRGDLLRRRFDNGPLGELFDPEDLKTGEMENIQPSQAAIALRNYLTLGRPYWRQVLDE